MKEAVFRDGKNTVSERDANGRFAPGNQVAAGNKGGPGRPPKEREERFMEITLSTVTYKDWREIIQKAVAQAKRGNPQARKFLADYLLGPPPQRHQVSGPDNEPLTIVFAGLKPGDV
jgi:hypothetical protein